MLRRLRSVYRSYAMWPAPVWRFRGYGVVSIAGMDVKLTAVRLEELHDLKRDGLEPGVAGSIRAAIHAGDTVIEIGAHVGYYTVLLAKLVGQEGRVYAFEPDPVSRRCLVRNLELNDISNVKVLDLAVTDSETPVSLSASRYGESNSSIGSPPERVGFGQQILVKATTLDGFCDRNSLRPDLVKIDVEGAEAAVLAGGSKTLNSVRRLFLELHPVKLRRDFGVEPMQFFREVISLGMQVYMPDGKGGAPFGSPVSESAVFAHTVRLMLVREQPAT